MTGLRAETTTTMRRWFTPACDTVFNRHPGRRLTAWHGKDGPSRVVLKFMESPQPLDPVPDWGLESPRNSRTGMSTLRELLSKPFRRSGVSAERRSLCLETGGWRRSAETPLRSFAIGSRSVDILVREFRGLSSPQFKNTVELRPL